ncbi:MAG: protease inhibitor I42 family protein [Clostridiales bacterium]|nr:protease inhibitor I42 family protein [Clostridiales bacterium]
MIVMLNLMQRFIAFVTALLSLIGINTSTVTVDLYTNPSSGYEWEYEFDRSGVLTLSDSYYNRDPYSILSSSSGGTRYFVFKAVSPGTVNVTFRYVKVIDGTKYMASSYVYTYNVDSNGRITLLNVK